MHCMHPLKAAVQHEKCMTLCNILGPCSYVTFGLHGHGKVVTIFQHRIIVQCHFFSFRIVLKDFVTDD